MATLADLLHHLVRHAPELSETNKQEYHDLIDDMAASEPAPGTPETREGAETKDG